MSKNTPPPGKKKETTHVKGGVEKTMEDTIKRMQKLLNYI